MEIFRSFPHWFSLIVPQLRYYFLKFRKHLVHLGYGSMALGIVIGLCSLLHMISKMILICARKENPLVNREIQSPELLYVRTNTHLELCL